MRGFSLIETLVAVVILVSAIVGPLTLASRSIRSAVYARDQVTAGFLAEETIEYVRMLRDGNKYDDKNWLNGLSDCIGANACSLDVTQAPRDAVGKCQEKSGPYGSNCSLLAFNAVRGWYGYAQKGNLTWQDTRFVREINIQTIPRGNNTNDSEAKIEVTVRWQTGTLPVRSIVARDYIYDW